MLPIIVDVSIVKLPAVINVLYNPLNIPVFVNNPFNEIPKYTIP